MSETLYRRLKVEGADSMSLDQVREVLRWQDENVLQAHEIATQIAAQNWEEEDKAAFVSEYQRAGGTEREAERSWEERKGERFRARSNDALDGAREAQRRRFAREF